jgi:hypothetical protein
MLLLLTLVSLVHGDVYMHNPRGANDRNCERNVNRNNGNLLYDTQNNAKGGYACPRAVAANNAQTPQNGLTQRMEFMEGSKLEVEWTSQHGCGIQKENAGADAALAGKLVQAGGQNVHCEMVMELGCSGTLDPKFKYTGNFAQNGVTAANALNTLNGLPAVPREGIPNSNADAATNRIGTNDNNGGQANLGTAQNANNGNLRFGVHETPEYYNECNRVKRNRGLFTADQNVNRRSAIGTRQNPNGGRRGLECPEERDYYPALRPAPFVPVAYLVDDQARCGAASTLPCGGAGCAKADQTCKCKGDINAGDWVGNALVQPSACVMVDTNKVPKTNAGLTATAARLYNRREWPRTKAACDTVVAAQANTATKVVWKQMWYHGDFEPASPRGQPFAALAEKGPVCDTIDYSRSNHLGNSGSDDAASRFTMTIPVVNSATPLAKNLGSLTAGNPQVIGEPCFLRLRYNMSSEDYQRNLTSAANGNNNSPIQQDPLVNVGSLNGENFYAQLALNTNQVARTFQDRSYIFYITKPTAAALNKNVLNVNVRGKRGNIVQVYPAVEYDFIPNTINEPANTLLAMQWVGSDYNPRRGCNDGEGGPSTGDNNVAQALKNNANQAGSNQNSRTDRMTLLMVSDFKDNYPSIGTGAGNQMLATASGAGQFFANPEQAIKFATADAKNQLQDLRNGLKCLTANAINAINNENRRENNPRNCAEGNALSPYFSPTMVDMGKLDPAKAYKGISARNNNFSNRDTKLKVMVGTPVPTTPTTVARVPTTTVPGVVQEYTAGVQEGINSLFDTAELKYDAGSGSYSSNATIDAKSNIDVPGYDPVENDDYGMGAKEGCTQDMIFYSAASSVSVPMIMLSIVLGFIVTL